MVQKNCNGKDQKAYHKHETSQKINNGYNDRQTTKARPKENI